MGHTLGMVQCLVDHRPKGVASNWKAAYSIQEPCCYMFKMCEQFDVHNFILEGPRHEMCLALQITQLMYSLCVCVCVGSLLCALSTNLYKISRSAFMCFIIFKTDKICFEYTWILIAFTGTPMEECNQQ